MLNLLDKKDGKVRGSQVVGASINYSPEFNASEPNLNLLRRLAESGGGRILDPENPADNTFLHDRQKTFQPRDLWEWLLKLSVLLFPLDVAVRRIQLDQRRDAPRVAEAAGLDFLLARRAARAGGRGITGGVVGAARTGALHPDRPGAAAGGPVPPAKAGHLAGGPGLLGPSASAAEDEPKPAAGTGIRGQTAPTSTTSRLLDAKRRAQRRKE